MAGVSVAVRRSKASAARLPRFSDFVENYVLASFGIVKFVWWFHVKRWRHEDVKKQIR